ncbi:MAG: hypothetical protein ACSHX0_10135 [Akkermansiaceae bacterium]
MRSEPSQERHQKAKHEFSRMPRAESRLRQIPSLSLESLSERFRQAVRNKTLNAVHKKVFLELSRLDDEQLMRLLDEVDTASDDNLVQPYLSAVLFDALCGVNRELAADYLVSVSEDGILQFRFTFFFDDWHNEDPVEYLAWLDSNRAQLSKDGFLFGLAEGVVLTDLIETDRAAGLEHVKTLPEEHSRDVVFRVFSTRPYLLPPDQAITFLRDALSNHDHEDILARVCGFQLCIDNMQAFFERHNTTQQESEAILFTAVSMKIGGGLGEEPVNVFNQRMRKLAKEEGLCNADDLTAVILGVMSERDRQDERAVDELLSYNPSPSALEIFLGERRDSLDSTQRERVTRRLTVLYGEQPLKGEQD